MESIDESEVQDINTSAVEPNEKISSVFKVYPTYTSVINKMDTLLDPRIVLGKIQGNKELKGLDDYSYSYKMSVLMNMDNILKNEIEHIDFPQVAYYFSEQTKNNELLAINISQLSSQYSSHMNKKVERIKNKPKPMPMPGDNGMSLKQKEELENKMKHEVSHKNSLSKMTPFKIPNPMK